ncbi:polysaccharide pyruvyl transferase family protein [Mycoplasma marinum]|uniref:polysaccharide pyruvyl transferase family protein n=1 Tax=Mycoplasma marinum TaxID=1937190 RepID=UPI001FE8641B|nr:polysaccharide pyruvyl transferase family protein [Mycoplasma marinum]
MLSKTKYHSVRDEHTKKLLEGIGFENVLNTSCPTTWKLKSFKVSIPNDDSSLILSFSLSNDDLNFVQKIINQASEKYKNVYIWIQTRAEKETFVKRVKFKENVSIIDQNLHSFFEVASKNNTFYIGSRLHASIFNLYNNNPSVTIKIDQRAGGINKAFNIPIIDYSIDLDLNDIEERIQDTINISDAKIKESKEIFINN